MDGIWMAVGVFQGAGFLIYPTLTSPLIPACGTISVPQFPDEIAIKRLKNTKNFIYFKSLINKLMGHLPPCTFA
jgi:hypothetical protein